jgi:hypothetical protein
MIHLPDEMASRAHYTGEHMDAPDAACFACVKAFENAHADGAHDRTADPDCAACAAADAVEVIRFGRKRRGRRAA